VIIAVELERKKNVKSYENLVESMTNSRFYLHQLEAQAMINSPGCRELGYQIEVFDDMDLSKTCFIYQLSYSYTYIIQASNKYLLHPKGFRDNTPNFINFIVNLLYMRKAFFM